jgi:glycosyltransferase involved in cell wall biosynthesis
VQKVLFIIPSLAYGGAARRLTLLAPRLPGDRFTVRVAVLGPQAPWVDVLRQAGVHVDVLGWRRPFDLQPFLAFRTLARDFAPDVLHAWGSTALRAAACLPGVRRGRPLFASAALAPRGRAGWVDRLLLRRLSGVIAFGESEKQDYLRAGVEAARVLEGPAAVADAPTTPAGPDRSPPVPAGDRVLLAAGPVEVHKGLYAAVWALDILRHVYDDLHLVVAGDGPDRPRVQQFARSLGAGARVHFTGPCGDLGPLLTRADLVWVPSLADRGRCVAAEAMGAGRPVVAARWPGLAEVIEDGVTGHLVPPDDKAALARQTRPLLHDADQRRRLGEAGRQRATDRFGIQTLVEACVRLYDGGRSETSPPGA